MWKLLVDLFKKSAPPITDSSVETPASARLKQEYEQKLQNIKKHDEDNIQHTFSSYHSEKALLCLELLTEIARTDGSISDNDKKLILDFMHSEFTSNEVTNAFSKMEEYLLTHQEPHFNIEIIVNKLNNCCTDTEKNRLVEFCKILVDSDHIIDKTESGLFGFIRRNLYTEKIGTTFSTCINCGSANFKRLAETVINEWETEKDMPAKSNSGIAQHETVPVTMVNSEIQWQCEECNHIWTTIKAHEKAH